MRFILISLCLSISFVGFLQALDIEELSEKAGDNWSEVERLIVDAEKKGYEEWTEFLLSSMSDVDLVNLKSEDFISYFEALDKNKKRVAWKSKIDDFLFFHHILPHRVSQEPLENFTAIYVDSLYDLIHDTKDMRKAVLRINEWVFTRMKYEPTMRWDQNALTTIRRGFGRCEEMAILCMKALRTVSIPARKVYSPWWPFTNSNHAWVEVWVDGDWHAIGGGEPTDLDNAWFRTASKRAAIIMGVIYGEIEAGEEIVYKKKKGLTVINTTPNYSDVTELSIQVKASHSPIESVSVAICVYNYSSLPPVGLKKTDKDGFVKFIVGKTDLFVYASKDSLIGYNLWKPSSEEIDTIVIEIAKKEIPDTSFWIYTRRIEKERKEPKYKPNRDSLKLLQDQHFCKINIVDSSIASVLDEKGQKLVNIFYNAKGGAKSLLAFYKGLSDIQKEIFLDYFNSLYAKDIVSYDTTDLKGELQAVLKSKEFAKADIPDSILEEYLISDRILFEQIGAWRKGIQSEFLHFRKGNSRKSVEEIFLWIEREIEKIEETGYFGPMKNPGDVYKTRSGIDKERYIFMAGILRSIGIPARVKWSYDALEYWDEEWREKSFDEKKKDGKKLWTALRFEKNGKDVTEKQRYYYDYSITRFKEYPKRLDPPIDTCEGKVVITLDEDPAYSITGWRNGFGDTYVRIKRVIPRIDTQLVAIEIGIPEEVKPGDLIVREYKGFDSEELGINKEELEKEEVLVLVFDTESEASRSTLKNAHGAINNFQGRVFLLATTEKRGIAERFLEEMGILKGELFVVSEDFPEERLRIKDLPSVILLDDGKCIFWVEGLFLHLSRLLEDMS